MKTNKEDEEKPRKYELTLDEMKDVATYKPIELSRQSKHIKPVK